MIQIMNHYENVINEFNKRNCKLLTTKEEYSEILNTSKGLNYKLDYIASCGHEHTVFYNVFKYRGTGLVCPTCKNIETTKVKTDKMKNGELSKTYTTEQEFNVVQLLQELDFEIIKAFDGCHVDLIYRPKDVKKDEWVGIQVKTTKHANPTYAFHLHTEYKNCLLLLYCCEDKNVWIIPENTIHITKVDIGFKKSKYNIYKVTKESTIENKLHSLYKTTSKYPFNVLDKPINIYQEREQEFRKYREEKINFLKFEYDEMEGTVYDFRIGNYKIQEKVCKMNQDTRRYSFGIYKNNGIVDKKRSFCQYDIGDNDFYWLNCEDKKNFFIIPEKILIDRKLIGDKTKKGRITFRFTINGELYKKSWLNDYIFSYDKIAKKRLLKMFIKI